MKVEVRQLERVVALLSVGMTVAIERGLLTTNEAGHFLWWPYTMGMLKECDARKVVIDMVHTATEMEDVEGLIPEQFPSALSSLREEALACLEGVGEYPYQSEKWLKALLD